MRISGGGCVSGGEDGGGGGARSSASSTSGVDVSFVPEVPFVATAGDSDVAFVESAPAGGDSHAVSPPHVASPASLVCPAGHATHAREETRSSARHVGDSTHIVPQPGTGSPPSRPSPLGQAVQWFCSTYSSTPHAQVVSYSLGLSPAGFVAPPAHEAHVFSLVTRSVSYTHLTLPTKRIV